ncbi:MAG: hypothetical protein NT013_11630 [Planctomycetia bacterium]|nr:hypothetical protein [Planctomycetia bacterium]
MPLTVSDKLLKTLEAGRRPVVVRDDRTKKGYAVMSEQVYARARPLIEFVSNDAAGPSDRSAETWTEEKNARRAVLINKKHDSKLTSAETRELNQLTEEVRQYQERVAPLHNHALAGGTASSCVRSIRNFRVGAQSTNPLQLWNQRLLRGSRACGTQLLRSWATRRCGEGRFKN